MIRIWNERSVAIGGCGADAVIKTLGTVTEDWKKPVHAEKGAAEFADHEGVFVDEADVRRAGRYVDLMHGRRG